MIGLVAIAFFVGIVVGLALSKLVEAPTALESKTDPKHPYRDGEERQADADEPDAPPDPAKPPLILEWAFKESKTGRVYSCPRCEAGWNDLKPRYCECAACEGGHFHLVCQGSVRRDGQLRDAGCGARWIMREKQKPLVTPPPAPVSTKPS
jgi:hypothetical protein